jgi:hypothetical protein
MQDTVAANNRPIVAQPALANALLHDIKAWTLVVIQLSYAESCSELIVLTSVPHHA